MKKILILKKEKKVEAKTRVVVCLVADLKWVLGRNPMYPHAPLLTFSPKPSTSSPIFPSSFYGFSITPITTTKIAKVARVSQN